ncbi:MAG: GspH/FimT family pseudopilin [Pseudomonadota bacterium]
MVGRKITRARERGLTLIELLVVIVILALASTVVLLTAPPSRPPVREEAERFAARLQLALDEAITASKPMRVKIDASGYVFEELEPQTTDAEDQKERWAPVGETPNLARREFDKRTTVTPEIADAANDNARELGDDVSAEGETDAEKGVYAIPLDPLGAQTAFSLRFSSKDGVWTASVDDGGKVTVKENE